MIRKTFHAVLLGQDFLHCPIFYCCLPAELGQFSPAAADHPLRSAIDRRLGNGYLINYLNGRETPNR